MKELNIETKLIVSIDGEVIYQDTGLGENGFDSIAEKSHRIPQQINNYKILHKNMDIKVIEEAEDLGTEIEIEQTQLNEECVCKKCGDKLICQHDGADHIESLCGNCA